jgi:hypothetical protein
VLILNQETGLVLPSAPEFGADGTWPPVATAWLPLRWELFETDTHNVNSLMAHLFFTLYRSRNPLLREDAESPRLIYEPSFLSYSVVAKSSNKYMDVDISYNGDSLKFHRKRRTVSPWGPLPNAEEALDLLPFPSRELRRLIHYVRWRRRDPVTQLPPGSTHELMHSLTTGLSVEHSQELASSLGLSLGAKMIGAQAQLSSQLEQKFAFELGITAQEEMSTKLTLTNQSMDRDRLFALWHIDHLVTVDTLTVPFRAWRGGMAPTVLGLDRIYFGLSCSGDQASWKREAAVEFVTSNEPFITSLVKEPKSAA